MKAAYYPSPGQVALHDVPEPELRPGVPLEHGIFTDAIGYCLYNGLKDRGIAVDA